MSKSKQILFKKMDISIFKLIDKLQLTEQYSSFISGISGITPEIKVLLEQLTTLSIFLLPFIFTSSFYFHNKNYREKVEIKSQVVSLANSILQQAKEVKQLKIQFALNEGLETDRDYERFIQKIINGLGIDKNDIIVSDFNRNKLEGELIKVNAQLELNSLTFNQFKLFLTKFTMEKGSKITEFNIKKNAKTNLLDIMLLTAHLINGSQNTNNNY